MDRTHLQKRIDAITWYHDFDFGEGLTARSSVPGNHRKRLLWRCIEQQLNKIDFRGKSVLDIGCWDGYWSFYAERRGAGSVLATDDQTQNWAGSEGFHLARELLSSRVNVNLNMSVHHLARLQQKFDIILFLGVYYHLFDPFHALVQVRHCCHADTLVVIEGPVGIELPPGAGLFAFANHNCEFLPAPEALRQLVQAAYLREVENSVLDLHVAQPAARLAPLGWRWRLGACMDVLRGSRAAIRERVNRIFPPVPPKTQRRLLRCAPFEGANHVHYYLPPFGLHIYDDRFREATPVPAAPAA